MIDLRDAKAPRTERQAALQDAGERELRRLQHVWPSEPRPSRVPRSMRQAFGPHTDHRLHPMPTRREGNGKIRSWLLAIVLFGGIAVLIFQPWR